MQNTNAANAVSADSAPPNLSPEVVAELLKATQEGFWFIDPETCTLDVNPAMCGLLGRPREEIIGRSIYDFVDEENAAIFRREIAARKAGKKGSYELALLQPDGKNRPCINNAVAIYNDAGVKIGSIGIWTEITKLRSVTRELEEAKRTLERRVRDRTEELELQNRRIRESERNYRTLFENAVIGIGRSSLADGSILHANKRVSNIFGYDDLDEFIRTFRFGDHAVENGGRPAVLAMFRQNPDRIHEVRMRDRNGKLIFIEVEARIDDENGWVDFVISDITEQKRIESSSFLHLRLIETLIKNSPLLIAVEDSDGTFRFVSQKFADLLGRPPEEIVGWSVTDLVDLEDSQKLSVANQQIIETGESLSLDASVKIHVDGRDLLFTKSPIKDDTGKVRQICTMGLDISEQMRVEKELRLANELAENANQAKSEFLSSMSHELRTPLNAIMGFADIIRNQYFGEIEPRYLSYVKDIYDSGSLLLELISDVLDLSAIEAGKRDVHKTRTLVQSICEDCIKVISHNAIARDIELSCEVPETPVTAVVDERAIKQILLNLLGNAIKYTPLGGRVRFYASADAGMIRFVVSDTGAGIPMELLPRLTQPFVQSSSDPMVAQEGWGLGLAIVNSLVEINNGSIQFENKEHGGAVISVSIPAETQFQNGTEKCSEADMVPC